MTLWGLETNVQLAKVSTARWNKVPTHIFDNKVTFSTMVKFEALVYKCVQLKCDYVTFKGLNFTVKGSLLSLSFLFDTWRLLSLTSALRSAEWKKSTLILGTFFVFFFF